MAAVGEDKKTFYAVYNGTNNMNLPLSNRKDCGVFYVEEIEVCNFRDALIKGSEMSKFFIENNLFESEEEANLEAVRRTYEKLGKIVDWFKEEE